jgi:iron complex transport system ATP-binding protein
MTALLSARGIDYRVGNAQLLAAVDVTVAGGELVAVIGPNGAGKSTLVGVLAGDLRPSAGSVQIGGTDIATIDGAELARLRAALGQGRTAGIPFSVAEVVGMGNRRPAGGPSAVADAMAAMDVADLADRIVGSLSGGEHTRVELARILVQDTEVILLDEPLAALDIAHEERVMRHLRSVAESGRGVLAVIHDLNAAAAHAHRFVLLAGGRVAAAGPADEVLNAALLSEVYRYPMTVSRVEGRLVVLPRD